MKKTLVNVGTIGHIDHGKRNVTTLALMVINASAPEIPDCYLEPGSKQPYYRRFEKKHRGP